MTIWELISSEGLTELAFLDGRQSSADTSKYKLTCFRESFMIAKIKFYFQSGQCVLHTSKLTKEFVYSRNWMIMCWPACSPD